MIIKSAIISFFIIVLHQNSFGQSIFSTKTFHKHEQVCNNGGTTEYDYLIQLKEDSTFNFIVYSTSYKSGYNSVLKEIYTGQYSILRDTVNTYAVTYNSFNKNKGDSSRLFRPTAAATKVNREIIFILSEKKITPLNSYLPAIEKCSPLEFDWLNSKFDLWQNKNPNFIEVFGATKN